MKIRAILQKKKSNLWSVVCLTLAATTPWKALEAEDEEDFCVDGRAAAVSTDANIVQFGMGSGPTGGFHLLHKMEDGKGA